MPATKASQKRRSLDIKGSYLRLLKGEPAHQADWPAAAELIDAGMAKGAVHRSATDRHNAVDALHGFAPTLQGRLFAQQLQEQQQARSVIGRLKKWVWVLAGAAAGLLADSFAGLLTEAMKRLLGW